MVFLQPVHSAVQDMPWGSKGSTSLAGQLWLAGGHAQAQGHDALDEHQTYAELWQAGTHEKGPSTLAIDSDDGKRGQPLSAVLRKRKHELLGENILQKMPWVDSDTHGGVPVLFKVLSAGKALPLQAHPDAELSRQLYELQPGREDDEQVRYDGVHKPEIALALTPFRGFIGFAPREIIVQRLEMLPELRDLFLARNVPVAVSKHLVQDMTDAYHELVDPHQRTHSPYSWHDKISAALGRLLGADKKRLGSVLKQILSRAENKDAVEWTGPEGEQLRSLIIELSEQYPGDSGVLAAPVFMNLAALEPGECIYAPADTIHAWLSGDIIEAMPASVNVHNTAFGPDPSVETLQIFTKMLSYDAKPLSDFKIRPEPLEGMPNDTTTIYRIPLEEFDVVKVYLSSASSSAPTCTVRLFTEEDGLGVLDGLGIVSVVRGKGCLHGFEPGSSAGSSRITHEVGPGSVVVVGKGTAIELERTAADNLEVYIAVCQPKTPA
ncbi:Mannose-6-phosphate isomerase [Tilletia horrida]|nr:Mannose-6-phosphate isomerase [Tilletia horrida]